LHFKSSDILLSESRPEWSLGEVERSGQDPQRTADRLSIACRFPLTFNTCDVTGELASKAFMRWGREKQNAVSKYPVAVSNQGHRAA
jgi:hypothetical protein